MSAKGLENLNVWQMGREIVVFVYQKILPNLPSEEKWGLISQIRRAAVSIPANIAEGYGRYYFQENIKHCYFARGSLDELLSHIILSFDLGYISEEESNLAKEKILELRKTLNGYIRYLNNRKLSDMNNASVQYHVDENQDIDIFESERRIRNKDTDDQIQIDSTEERPH
jgi:four helix bundle protein